MYRRLLAIVALCISLCAPAKGAEDDDLYVGMFSTAMWYACSDQKVAENIAQTFVTSGGNAAMSLFNQNALLCELFPVPTRLYVQTVVWHRTMRDDKEKMKVVLMWEWQDGRPSRSFYVLTLRAVNNSGVAHPEIVRAAM